MPSRANGEPSVKVPDPLPWMLPPPCIQTITGARIRGIAGAQTLRVRQSSLVVSAALPAGTRCGGRACGQEGPKSVAGRGALHGAGRRGARQRSSPTGAAA